MKKKINSCLLLTVFLTLMAALLMAVAIFYHIYREQVIEDMRACSYVLKEAGGLSPETWAEAGATDEEDGPERKGRRQAGESGNEAEISLEETSSEEAGDNGRELPDGGREIRVTVIGTDGEVLFDSETGTGTMENHSGRPEIQAARETGEGHAIRHSDTLGRDMYYFALRLDDGTILRVSREADGIWRVFSNMMKGIAGVAALMFLVCLFFAHYITADIVRPIEYLANHLEQAERIDAYEELSPFISTIRRQHEDILKSAKMRQEFTANVSHELKTPLTSISGYAELIETGIAGENDVQRFAQGIHRSADRLLTLINDIIRLSELDSDRMELSFAKIDLYEIAADCVEMLQVHAESHGVSIRMHGYHCAVQADRRLIEELVYNLCDNAIRYNKVGGTVDVTVCLRGNRICLSVKDTGIGISEKDQERVFERFYRVDKSHSRQTGGTGLGLAIVKHIVAKHRAEIELFSSIGEGTEICVLFCAR